MSTPAFTSRSNLVSRLATRWLLSDLNPPLGNPGGPCHIVDRIEKEVTNPGLKQQLTDKVEDGLDLSNPEAAKVYDLEVESIRGLFTRLSIGPHAQYRMDYRGVRLKDVKDAIQELSKAFYKAKSEGSPRYFEYLERIEKRLSLEYISPNGLFIALAPESDKSAKLITTYWKGYPDPKAPGQCGV